MTRRVEEEKELVFGRRGLDLVSLYSSIHYPPPSPQAGDRLWGCGRADYRPFPPWEWVPFFLFHSFLSAGSEVGGG